MADIVGEDDCTLVAHNMEYDWTDVIAYTAKQFNLEGTEPFKKLCNLPRLCTCINSFTKKQNGPLKSYFYHKIQRHIGPSLEKLANYCNEEYNHDDAHDAMYDVDLTRKCLTCLIQQSVF